MTVVWSVTDLDPMLANMREFWLGYGAVRRQREPSALFRSGVDHPLFNGVLRSGPGERWARLVAEMDGVGWMCWLGPDSPPDLAGTFLDQGAQDAGTLPIWTAEIDRVPAVAGPPGLVVEEVSGDAAVDRWARMCTPASDLPAEIAPAVSEVERARPPDDGYVRLAGWMDGTLVASSAVRVAHGVASVFVVSTVPAYRRRGIGRAMTAAALDVAARRGMRVAVLVPTDQGAPVYERMGFRPVAEYRILVPGDSV